ncbi:MAG: ABC transporter ATP-binding protein [Cellulosilyticaceae bacterium]
MKAKDPRIMKRLLAYAKPFKWWFALVFIFMLITTVADLARPVLIGSAVDLFTEGYKQPFVEREGNDTVLFDGKTIGHLKDEKTLSELDKVYQMMQYQNEYYWIEDVEYDDAMDILELTPQEYGQHVVNEAEVLKVEINEKVYKGRVLEEEDLKILRSLSFKKLIVIGVLFMSMILIGFALVYVQVLLLQHIGQKIIFSMRQEVYEKMLNLPFRFYHENPVGKLMTRVTNDTETLNEMYTSVLVNLLKQSFFLIGVTVMMFVTDIKTATIVVLLIPFVIGATIIYKTISRKAYRQVRTKLTEMNTFLSEHLSGMRIIQIFTREKDKIETMDEINNDLYKAGMKELIAFALFRPFIFVLCYIGIGLVLIVGGQNVLLGTMTIGALVIMVSYTKDFFAPIEELAENFSVLQSAFASAEKIFTILDEENEILDGELPIQQSTFKGTIEFENVWFAYKEDDWILKDVSFKIEAGQKVAFVGATGAGKTSILSLICRYYDIQKGEIRIDGVPIQKYKIADLRRQIGQVLQDVFLFTGDIKQNIRLGDSKITLEKIQQASEMVNADTFIQKLDKGYDSEVIERGASLSTGQRQLISFARAVVFEPKIFILDEATANIDTETESLIQDALQKMMEGRTTLMVAHRLSTIQHADNIIVLHKGQIKEMGNHQELLLNKNIYYNLYQLALKNQVME